MHQRVVFVFVVFLQFCSSTGQTSVPPLTLDNTAILDVRGEARVQPTWLDSYSFNGSCYCQSTFDHAIGDIIVAVGSSNRTVREVCALLGPGPGRENRPIYNDIQCGNGPPNDAGDEDTCPGRVDHGREGCGYIGPRWQLPGGAIAIPFPPQSSAPALVSASIRALLGILSCIFLFGCSGV